MRDGRHGGVGRAPRCRVWEGIGGDAEASRGEVAMMAGAREEPWAHEGDPAGGQDPRPAASAPGALSWRAHNDARGCRHARLTGGH